MRKKREEKRGEEKEREVGRGGGNLLCVGNNGNVKEIKLDGETSGEIRSEPYRRSRIEYTNIRERGKKTYRRERFILPWNGNGARS